MIGRQPGNRPDCPMGKGQIGLRKRTFRKKINTCNVPVYKVLPGERLYTGTALRSGG